MRKNLLEREEKQEEDITSNLNRGRLKVCRVWSKAGFQVKKVVGWGREGKLEGGGEGGG